MTWVLRRDWLRRAGDCLAAERARWGLWGPVALGVGIGVYFAFDAEPERWTGPTALVVALGLMASSRRLGIIPHLLAWALMLGALGFSAAQLRTQLVDAPVITKKTGAVMIDAVVGRVEIRTGHRRLWLQPSHIDRLAAVATPERVRVRSHGVTPPLRPGDRIRVRAMLHPPPGPAAPGAFDFARRAWFQRLGGVGFAIGRIVVVDRPAPVGLATRIQAFRHDLTRRILAALPGPPGAVAAALMTGERGAIPENVLSAMRDAGLAHLLAISGLHIGLVGGLLFFAVRLLLAFNETITLRYPIKKWAALAAVIGSFGYLLVSGGTLPTQRAFLMLALALLAVMIDRVAISMNLVAWAALVILMLAPESLLSVSFQMSFAAVVGLVAVYETAVLRHARGAGPVGPARRTGLYLGAVLLSTLVAGSATAPFALFHFNRFALYGMLANLIAVPLTALWIMPWAVVAFALMPFGLEALALKPMGLGIEAVIAVASWVQSLSGAVLSLPALSPWGVMLIAFGGLWLCLWQQPGW
ncbi:MAG: ComEC/Rec2 family competence protein, partial [Alphaproteobacteria bacterium]